MDLQLKDKVVLISGSSNGIGLACATRLFIEGARVVLTGRSPERLFSAASEMVAMDQARVLTLAGDLTTVEGIGSALTATGQAFGQLDIVIGCIGNGRGRAGWEQGEAEWQRTMAENLWPAVRLSEQAVPLLSGREDAAIVLVGSIAGRERLGPIAYGTAKAGLAAYATRLGSQVADLGIRVVCVEPGNVLIPGGRWAERLESDPESVEAILASDVPQHRLGTPEEIANVVCFLASPLASFVTATRVVVDGGQSRD
jgi:3-oxoacyl-[acyl-carrier protein] reductase